MNTTTDLFERFEQLNEIGASLSSEHDIDRLLEKILLAAKRVTQADGGTLYLKSDDGKSLRFEIVRTDSLQVAYGGASGEPISARFKDLPLYRDDGEANNSLVAAYSAIHARTVNIADAYTAEGFDFSGTRKFDEMTGYRSQSFLTVPLKNHESEVIGVLQLINAIDPASGAVRVFSNADQRLAESLASQAAVALTNRLLVKRFEHLNEIGASLSSERNIDRLLENILLAAKGITHADGGTLYRISEDGRSLRFEIVRTDSLKIAYGGTSGEPASSKFKALSLHRDDGQANNSLVAAYAAIHKCTVNIADAYTEEGFDFSGTRKFDQLTGYRSQSFLTVPLKNHENDVIGVLQLINATDPVSGAVRVFSQADQQLAESLASQAAVALTNRLLVIQLEELFEAFITMINLAIDEKSPYTGGHCQRVPSLTMMLAEAADGASEGPLSGFRMSDKDRYELKIAGLLHDCGKVTTPVHVVDKASKLQTIFDRIALVDTRFELIRRDAELSMLRGVLAGDDRQVAGLDLQQRLAAIDDDRAFLRRVNVGGELMKPEDQERVRSISKSYRWTSADGVESDFLSDDEVENLTIRAGTLTFAERETINHHIVATNRMLESLPWPTHLKHVPEYAGGHHERMDGKGYPAGLTREQMSVPARIMGVADIFEALTARDRPYKPGMKLSQAMAILGNMSKSGHIDPDLFDVFVTQKVYLTYARQYLDAAQIDELTEV